MLRHDAMRLIAWFSVSALLLLSLPFQALAGSPYCPISELFFDGVYYHYETSCCNEPEHFGIGLSETQLTNLGCGRCGADAAHFAALEFAPIGEESSDSRVSKTSVTARSQVSDIAITLNMPGPSDESSAALATPSRPCVVKQANSDESIPVRFAIDHPSFRGKRFCFYSPASGGRQSSGVLIAFEDAGLYEGYFDVDTPAALDSALMQGMTSRSTVQVFAARIILDLPPDAEDIGRAGRSTQFVILTRP